jgi:hypothetical protein
MTSKADAANRLMRLAKEIGEMLIPNEIIDTAKSQAGKLLAV